MQNLYEVIRRPVVTEKSTDLKEAGNVIAFEVNRRATKPEIKAAVEKLFKVKVKRVRTINVPGKHVTLGRNRGKRSNWKKALVTLAQGSTIEFFENR
ncbi:MAG: 50S ribosomal protein L23 [Deltaproteobacteria bacterium]|nr:50S ribosomal protein L23 [Deltaproteobacteria bacterium]